MALLTDRQKQIIFVLRWKAAQGVRSARTHLACILTTAGKCTALAGGVAGGALIIAGEWVAPDVA